MKKKSDDSVVNKDIDERAMCLEHLQQLINLASEISHAHKRISPAFFNRFNDSLRKIQQQHPFSKTIEELKYASSISTRYNESIGNLINDCCVLVDKITSLMEKPQNTNKASEKKKNASARNLEKARAAKKNSNHQE